MFRAITPLLQRENGFTIFIKNHCTDYKQKCSLYTFENNKTDFFKPDRQLYDN